MLKVISFRVYFVLLILSCDSQTGYLLARANSGTWRNLTLPPVT